MNAPDTVAGLFLTTDPARLARRHLGVVLFSLAMAMFAAAARQIQGTKRHRAATCDLMPRSGG